VFSFFKKKTEGKEGAKPTMSPFHHSRFMDQSIAEMLGLIRRVLADGVVTEEEAKALSNWTAKHPEVVDAWPGKVLAHRLEKIFQDGVVDEYERTDLQRLLRALAGGDWGVRQAWGGPGGIPLSDPPPVLIFPEQRFAFTGEFAFGPISSCRSAVESLGGECVEEVTGEVDVLVIGTFGASDWTNSPEAGEIKKALGMQEEGGTIAIVSEDYWASSLP
jgi:hypothetical protein